MTRVLFLCSQNRLRSPTAERVFSTREEIEAKSAGLDHDAENVVTPEWIGWADIIFVMEKSHRNKLTKRYKPHLKDKRIICLDIPDRYDHMDPELIALLKAGMAQYL